VSFAGTDCLRENGMGDDGEDLVSVVVPVFGVIKFAYNKQWSQGETFRY
jgi:hypothetical protein